MRLQTKLTLVMLPLVFTAMSALGWITHAHLKENGQQVAIKRMDQTLLVADRTIQKLVASTSANVEVFAASATLERYAVSDDASLRYGLLQSQLLEAFRSYQRAYPAYSEIRFLSPDGYEETRISTSGAPNLTRNEGAQDYFRRISQMPGDLAMAFLKNPDDGLFVLSALRRLRLPSHQNGAADTALVNRGYLGVSVSLREMQNWANEMLNSGQGEVRVVDWEGTVYVAPDDRKVSEDNEVTTALLLDAIEHAGEIIHSPKGFLYKARSSVLGMHIVVRLSEDALLFSAGRLAFDVVVITMITMLAMAWLLHSVLQRIVLQPIGVLQQTTHEIGNGNLVPTIPPMAKDELGELATSVAEMGRRLHEASDHVEYLATHDPLTGLPNRMMFRDILGRALARAERRQKHVALLFLDIDNFKRVNDSHGHQYGDQLLIEFGKRIEQYCRNSDLKAHDAFSRLGGDEFLIMLEDIEQPYVAEQVAERILDVLKEKPLRVRNHNYYVGTSIGISVYPEDGRDVDDLIRNADIAMYQAKDLGKNNYQFFSKKLHVNAAEHMEMERRLHKALTDEQLFLLYQPQLDVASGRLVEAEALLRWDADDSGVMAPDAFISVAEESGLINDIGEWVLREALAQKLAWEQAGMEDVRIAVNVSSVQLRRGGFDTLVEKIFAAAPQAAKGITIELTESALMENSKEGFRVLHALERMGFDISLDDFGTGYSSLSYLHTLPIHYLKIDRAFISPLPDSSETRDIVTAIIAMAHSLGVVVVAEGVETEEQLAFLRELGCDRIQGYLIAKPMSAEMLADGLQNGDMQLQR